MLDVWSTLSVLVHVPISYVDKSGMYANVIFKFPHESKKWTNYFTGLTLHCTVILGRLFRIDLIQWVSNVRLYVRQQKVSSISMKFGV